MTKINKTYLIYGVSRGLGQAIMHSVPKKTDKIYGISRSKPDTLDNLIWVPADLSNPCISTKKVKKIISNEKIDVLIYNVGIWENTAFTAEYNFQKVSANEITNIINTNITTCIQSIQIFIENLKLSNNAKIILIGSTWGIENHNGSEVVFSATKFALRGITHALREILREYKIGVSVLNLGYIASDYNMSIPTEQVLKETSYTLIPLSDVIKAIQFIISTSKATCIKEILMPAMLDKNI